MEVKEYKDDEIIKKMHASLDEKVNKYWRVQTRRSRGGLPDAIWKKLQCFGVIQNVTGDGNCGIYAAIEGLLDCRMSITTDVHIFRREMYDYIDKHRDSILCNFNFSGKKLLNGKVRGKTRDNWLTNDVMKRIWDEGGQYLPICPKKYWVEAD